MRYVKATLGVLLILAASGCTKSELYSGPALPPSGLKDTGSAGTVGGAAAAPAGAGVVGRSAH